MFYCVETGFIWNEIGDFEVQIFKSWMGVPLYEQVFGTITINTTTESKKKKMTKPDQM